MKQKIKKYTINAYRSEAIKELEKRLDLHSRPLWRKGVEKQIEAVKAYSEKTMLEAMKYYTPEEWVELLLL